MDFPLASGRIILVAEPGLAHGGYSVSWIAALLLELTAAKAMPDCVTSASPSKLPQGQNLYIEGDQQAQNPAPHLPGTMPLRRSQSRCGPTSPTTRFGLMVGVNGDYPSIEHNIRLGDGVVSKPDKTDGDVIQWDFGHTLKEGLFVRNGTLDHHLPSFSVLPALSRRFTAYMDINGNYFGFRLV